MKFLSLITLIFSATMALGQTAVISNKSHAGDLSLILVEPDNFGAPDDFPVYDTILLLENNCLVQKGYTSWQQNRILDTICDHTAFKDGKYDLKTAKKYFGERPVFIGFKKKRTDQNNSDSFWINGNPHQSNVVGFFALFLLAYLAYLITPLLRKKEL